MLANTIEATNQDATQNKENEGADSDVKAPNGKFFKQNDLQYLLDNKYTKEQAIAILSNTDKYKKTDNTKSDTDKTKEDVKK